VNKIIKNSDSASKVANRRKKHERNVEENEIENERK